MISVQILPMIGWFKAQWQSADRLSWWTTAASWGIAIFTIFVIIAGGKRDRLKDQKIAESNQLAATANLQAATAVEGQKKLEVEAEHLKSHNLQLQLELEKERSARIKLEDQVGFRSITQQQEDILVVKLREAKGSTVKISAPNSSPESSQFSERIRSIFIKSGWKADSVLHNMIAGVPVEPGVIIVVQNDKNPLGVLVQQSFKDVGIELKGAIDPKAPQEIVYLVIGPKS